MSERYVREILEKLEEIEKLHTKLRSLVPRVKNNELENSLNTTKRRSIAMESKHFVAKERNDNGKDSPGQKPVVSPRSSLRSAVKCSETGIIKLPGTNTESRKHFKKFKERFNNRVRRFSANSVDFVTKQWQDKNDKIKNFLSNINDDDIILVSRASQTIDDDIANAILANRSAMKLPSRRNQSFDKRRSTLQDISEWFLERFDYFRDPSQKRESSVSIHDYGLENIEPRKVRKISIIPDERSETSNLISAARNISVNNNRKRSSLDDINYQRRHSDI
ncbi:hypothetical protein ANTRET_LOCUS617 [Anthophora retusa]